MRGIRANQDAKQFDAAVGQRIELTRKAVGVSGDDLAKRLGIGRTTLYYLESGRHSCSPFLLALIAMELGVSTSALIPRVKVCERSL